MRHLLALFLPAAVFLTACESGSGTAESSENDSTATDLPVAPEDGDHPEAVCIWDGIGIYAEHSPKLAQWQAGLAMGETVTVLDQIEKDEKGKTVTYLKVRQADTGKEGWVASYYVVPGGRPFAVYEELNLYSRPDLVAKTDNLLEHFDLVAVTGEKDDWVRITGKRRSGTWIDQDRWVKNRGLSNKKEDLALATLVTRALKEKDETKRLRKLQDIVNTPDLKSGNLYPLLDALLTQVEETSDVPIILELDTAGSGE